MSYNSGNTTTTIANNTAITKIIFSADASEQTTAFTDALKSDVIANTAQIALNTTDIATNTADILTKQNIINGSNKLAIANVDLTGSDLLNCDFGSSINTKFTNIDATLSAQATTNSTVSTNISNLSSGKQDLLSSGNKLNPQFITTSGGGDMTSTKFQYLTSIDADISTKFNGKADLNNTTFTGTTTTSTLVVNGPLSSKSIVENIASSYTSFASNILTYAFNNNSLLYFNGLMQTLILNWL
jgi:hypothetical protein